MNNRTKSLLKAFYPFRFYTEKIMLCHNLGRFFLKHRIPLLPSCCENRIYRRYNCMISNKAIIGDNIKFPHPLGIIIGEGVEIGDDVTIYQNVTVGRRIRTEVNYPTVEDHVIIYCNSVVLGDIVIRESTVIGANSLVLTSTDVNSVYAGNPARRIK